MSVTERFRALYADYRVEIFATKKKGNDQHVEDYLLRHSIETTGRLDTGGTIHPRASGPYGYKNEGTDENPRWVLVKKEN